MLNSTLMLATRYLTLGSSTFSLVGRDLIHVVSIGRGEEGNGFAGLISTFSIPFLKVLA